MSHGLAQQFGRLFFFCLTSTNSYLIACYIHSGVEEEYVVKFCEGCLFRSYFWSMRAPRFEGKFSNLVSHLT